MVLLLSRASSPIGWRRVSTYRRVLISEATSVGLVPGEHSSGPKRRQGSIPKAGNSAARRMLVEVAWHYQHSPRVSPIIATRQDGLPKEVTDIAWKAQLRLNAKFKRLLARPVMKTKAVVAVARELTGFVWAIGREVQSSGWQGIKTDASSDTAA